MSKVFDAAAVAFAGEALAHAEALREFMVTNELFEAADAFDAVIDA